MLYREAGQYKTSYAADQALLPILQDRIGIFVILLVTFVIIPVFATDFFLGSIMIPFLVFALAAIGLNILTGYAGQLSLGTGAFMGVGAYSCYKLTTIFPDVNILIVILLSGIFSALVGVLFGLPSLRIKGLYLAITTLAAQFFLEWCFIRIAWLYNYNDSGAIEVPQRKIFDIAVTGASATPTVRYLLIVGIVALLALVAANVLRGRIGRSWMMIRDMDIAAELMGVRPFGGLGSILGCFLGAAFIWVLPILMRMIPDFMGWDILAATMEHITNIIIGVLIIFFLIVEPHGLARLWQVGKEKLRSWPFPYASS